MDAKTIQKYKKYSVSKLLKQAEKYFNTFVRYRDTDANGFGRCISSSKPLRVPSQNAQAGHYFPAGKIPELRFHEDNVHLQGKSDNYFASGNLTDYRKNLIRKIGQERLTKIELIAAQSKRNRYKWDRFYLIEVIETYKLKVKQLEKTKNF